MSTYRVRRRSRYTTVDRATVNDDRLSFRARGVLVWLLDKPDDWRCTADEIARAGAEGRDAVRAALRELEAAGYLVRARIQGERGRWITVTEVHERPPAAAAGDGIPGVGQPAVGQPVVGGPGAVMSTGTDELIPKTLPTPSAPAEEAPVEPTVDEVARGLVDGYWQWVTEQTGKPPVALRFPALVKLIVPFLAAGYTSADVKHVLAAMHRSGRPLSRQSIEAHLQGRARVPRPPGAPPVPEDRAAASGVVAV